MLKNDSVIPLYQQVADDIRHRIETSEYTAGQMIPSETKLCEIYQVSRITVRNAISKLVEEEILVKRHGKGTFVQNTKIDSELLSFAGFTTTWQKRNIKTYNRILAARKTEATKKVASRLNIEEGGPVVYLKRLRYANGHAVLLEHVYLDYEKYAFLLDTDLDNKSLYAVMAEKTGLNPERSCSSLTTLEAADATTDEQALLELNDRNAVLVMEETVIKDSGEVVHFTKQILSGSFFKFSMTNRNDLLALDLPR